MPKSAKNVGTLFLTSKVAGLVADFFFKKSAFFSEGEKTALFPKIRRLHGLTSRYLKKVEVFRGLL